MDNLGYLPSLIMFFLAVSTVRKLLQILGELTAPQQPSPTPHRGLPTNYREYVEDLYGGHR